MDENTFYISLKDTLKNKLIKDLIKDEEFKDLNIEDLIKRTVEDKLNSDIDFNIKKSNIKNNIINEEKEYIKKCMNENKDIKFNQDNPKNNNTSAYHRYERYKKATNYDEFIELGGDNKDYYSDFRKEYLKILD